MKYFLRVTIALLIALGIIFGVSYQYRQKKISEDIVFTTQQISTTEKGETTTQKTQLIHEDKESGYKFYLVDDKGYIEHNGLRKEKGGWGWVLSACKIETHYGDFDGDGEKELIVLYANIAEKANDLLITDDKTDFTNYHTTVAMIKEAKDSAGRTTDFNCLYADEKTWKKPFSQAISLQTNQLKSCTKYLQIVMDDNDTQLEYDKKTGISDNKYVFYAKALKTPKSDTYSKLIKWNKGAGNYYVNKDGKLCLSIMVLGYYEGWDKAQYIGNIDTEIAINRSGVLDMKPSTIKFTANDRYVMPDPRKETKEKFTYTITNSSPATTITTDKNIDWLEATFNANKGVTEELLSFGDLNSQIKDVETVKITQSYIELTAKAGFAFSDRVTDDGDYSLVINEGAKDEREISYKSQIIKKDGVSVLKITFDKKYKRSELEKLSLKFGA